jgi:hypothetical protein
MLSAEEFIRFISLIVYLGFIISSITGFVRSGDIHNEDTIAIVTASLVVFIQNIVYFVIETLKLYERSFFITNNLYYIRAGLIIESSILCFGISTVGVGFGVFGIIIFLVNMLAGVFLTDHINARVAPFSNSEDSEALHTSHSQNLD